MNLLLDDGRIDDYAAIDGAGHPVNFQFPVDDGYFRHLGIEAPDVIDDTDVAARAAWYAEKIAKMPADGIVMAKEAFRLVEQLQAYNGEEVASYLFHAYGTNLQFEDDEFNFVKVRAQHGTKRAFELRDEHFDVPEPS